MTDDDLRVFQDVIFKKFGCESSFVGSVDVIAEYGDGKEWTGEMHQFAIPDFLGASHCYTWFFDWDGTWVIPAVLKTPRINTAVLAFQSFIADPNVQK